MTPKLLMLIFVKPLELKLEFGISQSDIDLKSNVVYKGQN